jgi:hypothetical protein
MRRVWNKNSYNVINLLQDNLLTSPPPPGLAGLFGITNIKYLVLRQDIRPASATLGSKWDWERVSSSLSESVDEGIEMVEEIPYMSLWRNNNLWAHIYVTSDLIKVPMDSSIDCLPEISAILENQDPWAIVEDDIAIGAYKYLAYEINQDNQCLISRQTTTRNSSVPDIQSWKVNPTKYKIQIEKSKDPYLLVFSETFHPQWVLDIEPSTSSPILSDKSPEYNMAQHVLVNGYANGWWIDKPGTSELTIEFLPQRWYKIGWIISIATLFLCFIYLIFIFIRRLTGWI